MKTLEESKELLKECKKVIANIEDDGKKRICH